VNGDLHSVFQFDNKMHFSTPVINNAIDPLAKRQAHPSHVVNTAHSAFILARAAQVVK
jgi:hypothetical protein